MSNIKEVVDSIESRFNEFLKKMNDLQNVNQNLLENLEKSNDKIVQQDLEIARLKTGFEALKTTNALLGSDEYKRDTKLKINSLIREIDYCIAQLSD